MILYHGNQDKNMIPQYGKGNVHNDYGIGFYTTVDIELAKEWSYNNYDPQNTNIDNHWLHTYELDEGGVEIYDLTELDILYWLAQLYKFRLIDGLTELQEERKNRFLDKYYKDLTDKDVILGWRADDSYFKYARDFLSVDIYKETLEEAIMLGNLGEQFFIQSQNAFDRLKIKDEPVFVEGFYKNKYLNRDKIARNEYEIKRTNNQYLKNKTTILDII
jgi:hypothetical protein